MSISQFSLRAHHVANMRLQKAALRLEIADLLKKMDVSEMLANAQEASRRLGAMSDWEIDLGIRRAELRRGLRV